MLLLLLLMLLLLLLLLLLINAHTLRTHWLAFHGIEGLATHSLLAILNV